MAELVSSAHARCFFAFESLVRALKQPARDYQDQIPPTDIHNEFERYTIWAGNVGAAHSGKRYGISLDYRLREASFLKEQVLKLLSTLEERVSTAAGLVRGERKPFKEQIEESDSEASTFSDLGVDQEEEGKESEDSPWEISSDSSNGDGSPSQHRQTHQKSDEPRVSRRSSPKVTARPGLSVNCSPISEMPRLTESIKFTITCLYRLPIRKPAPLDRIKDRTSIDSAVYQHFDVLYVKDKFPKLQSQVATRLGKMITRRRQILYYREAHKQSLDVARVQPKITPVPEAPSTSSINEGGPQVTVGNRGSQATPSRLALSHAASSHFTLRSKATTVRPGELTLPVSQEHMDTLFAPSVAESKSSMASSYAGKNIRIDVPSRPKNDDGQELELFECPYCLLTKNISNDRKWKKHVLEDVQPYVCTYGDCELYDHFFDSRDAWFKHEAQHHRTKWSCNIDSHPEYDSDEDFLLHMRSDHDQKFDEAQFSLLESMFRRPTKSLEGTCNLCHRLSKNLRSHLSKHLQQIAIFALPRVNETAGSGQVEHDTRSSRYKKDRLNDGESSGSSSSSSTGVLSDRQYAPNDSTSDTFVEDDYDEGEGIPDAVEDQGWDSVTDKFSKARERTFRRLRVLIFEINDEGRDKMVSLIERLQGEPIVIVGYRNSAADAVRNHATPDAIIIGDVFGSTVLDTSIRRIRDVTDIPIIIVRESASNLNLLSDFLNWTEFIRPSEDDIEEALGNLCQWAPIPPHWRNHAVSAERPETPQQPSCFVPFRRDPDFVDRAMLLDQIREHGSAPASRVALVGLGGMGKSQLAIEYCYRTAEQSPETWVFWVHASNAGRIEKGYRDIADQVKLAGRKDPQADVFKLVHNWLRNEKNGRWLLVLDNADDGAALSLPASNGQKTQASGGDGAPPRNFTSYLPQSKTGSVLVTSRTRSVALQLAEERDIIPIEPMDDASAQALLQKTLGEEVDKDSTAELADALEFMPLALVQAAAYIQQRAPRCSVQQYLEQFHKSDRKKTSLLDYDGGHLRRDDEAKNSILITWQISFDHILKTRRSAADLLSLMSFFDRQGIPETLIRNRSGTGNRHEDVDTTNADDENSGRDSDESESEASVDDGFEEDILTLRNYSFIAITTEATFNMHRLVQLATRKWLEGQNQLEMWKQQYINILCAAFPIGEHENWAQYQALFPHAKSALSQPPKSEESLRQWALLLYNAAWYAWQKGSLGDAEELSIRSMNVRIKVLGKEHKDTLSSMAMVGRAADLAGRWKEAEELEVEVMETSKRVLGDEHPSTLASMANLASTYRNQGRWKEAEELEVEVMETSKRVLGDEHPDMLASMANLASTYRNHGRWKEAEELDVQVMETRKRVLGDEHPSTLISMANLAHT